MKTLIPIKIKVVKGGAGEHQMEHPQLTWQGMPISQVIDREGIGMHYEKVNRIANGADEMFAVTALPREIVDLFIEANPTLVTEMTDSETETFWGSNLYPNQTDEVINNEVLTGIQLKKELGITLNQDDTDALDPLKDTTGINKNPMKTWARYKTKKNLA